jgi:hypothetical protein
MSVIKKFTQNLTSAFFSMALGDVFEWGPSVPTGAQTRQFPESAAKPVMPRPAVAHWTHHHIHRTAVG